MSAATLLFYGPKVFSEAYPWGCFTVAAALISLQLALVLRASEVLDKSFFRKPAVFAGLLWLIYGLYEPQLRAGFPNANIRIDMLVLTPILYCFSVLAAYSLYNQLRGPPPPATPPDESV